MSDPILLKKAESPTKARFLELVDEVRQEIESGRCLSLVLILLFTELKFDIRSGGEIGMAKIAGILGRAWLDATNALDDD